MLSQLRDIVEQVSKVEDVYQALDIFVKQTCEAMSTECCTVYLANEEMHPGIDGHTRSEVQGR